jgi:hypothetical protein
MLGPLQSSQKGPALTGLRCGGAIGTPFAEGQIDLSKAVCYENIHLGQNLLEQRVLKTGNQTGENLMGKLEGIIAKSSGTALAN